MSPEPLPREFLEIQAPDTRWWMPFALKSEYLRQVRGIWREITKLRREMTTAENDAYNRAAEIVGLVKAEFASLHQRIDAAVEDKDAAVQAGVTSALAEDSASDASRLNGLLDELAQVLPAQVPDVPVPDPGTPAEVPVDDVPAAGGDFPDGAA